VRTAFRACLGSGETTLVSEICIIAAPPIRRGDQPVITNKVQGCGHRSCAARTGGTVSV